MKKWMKWLIGVVAVLVVAAAVWAVIEFTKKEPEPEPQEPEYITIIDNNQTDYVVTLEYNAGTVLSDAYVKFYNKYKSCYDENPKLNTSLNATQGVHDSHGKEIVIGDTGCEVTDALKQEYLKKDDYGIFQRGEAIYILGGTEEATAKALEEFINLLTEDSFVIEKGFTWVHNEEYAGVNVTLNGVELKDYKIVVAENCDHRTEMAARLLKEQLKGYYGIQLSIIDDSKEKTSAEILVGSTNRDVNDIEVAGVEGETYALSGKDGTILLQGEGYMASAAVGDFLRALNAVEPGDDKSAEVTIQQDENPREFQFKDAQSMILIISDGCGFNHINWTYDEGGLEYFFAEDMPNHGEAITNSYYGGVTDSAAAATALSSGYKTENGRVGMDINLVPHQNIREVASAAGAATGVITTDVRTGATPAGFTAHVDSRDDGEDISIQQSQCGMDYFAYEMESRLLDYTAEMLSTLTAKGDRIFAMIEEAKTDKGGHNNDEAVIFNAVNRVNQTTLYAICYVYAYPDTALIFTADHETGGILYDEEEGYHFTTGDHTGVNVPVYAIGSGTEYFNDKAVDNTEIAKFMGRIFGVEDLGGDVYADESAAA